MSCTLKHGKIRCKVTFPKAKRTKGTLRMSISRDKRLAALGHGRVDHGRDDHDARAPPGHPRRLDGHDRARSGPQSSGDQRRAASDEVIRAPVKTVRLRPGPSSKPAGAPARASVRIWAKIRSSRGSVSKSTWRIGPATAGEGRFDLRVHLVRDGPIARMPLAPERGSISCIASLVKVEDEARPVVEDHSRRRRTHQQSTRGATALPRPDRG